MNRIEFCKLLVETRENKGVGKNEMCRKTGFTFVQLQLLEDKPNNFAMDKAFDYLKALDSCIYINSHKIQTAEDISNFVKEARKGKFSQRSLAVEIGCTRQTIANIERGSNIITIDNFLKIVEVLGYTLEIKTNEKN